MVISLICCMAVSRQDKGRLLQDILIWQQSNTSQDAEILVYDECFPGNISNVAQLFPTESRVLKISLLVNILGKG